MGRGHGFHPRGAALNVGPVGSGLATDHLGDGRAGVGPNCDGRKRPLSSPPLLGVSEFKKNRLLSSSENLSNLDRDAMSALIATIFCGLARMTLLPSWKEEGSAALVELGVR